MNVRDGLHVGGIQYIRLDDRPIGCELSHDSILQKVFREMRVQLHRQPQPAKCEVQNVRCLPAIMLGELAIGYMSLAGVDGHRYGTYLPLRASFAPRMYCSRSDCSHRVSVTFSVQK